MSLGCFSPPSEASIPPIDLVRNSTAIVLATVVTTEQEGGDAMPSLFKFKTKEFLKGEAPESFTYWGYPADRDRRDFDDFNGHNDASFWSKHYGNSTMDTMCQVFGFFEVGQTYLIIATEDPHFKGYEKVRREDDFWLQVVRQLSDSLEK